MGFYSNVRMEYAAFEYTTYTESFISLFVEFYNSLEQADPSSIKIIIRPNNVTAHSSRAISLSTLSEASSISAGKSSN